jgi:predicted MPP superfamily phosphohydrolase
MSLQPGPPEHSPPHTFTRRAFIAGGASVGVGMAAYAGMFARHQLEIVPRTFSIKNLPDAFQGFRIAQLSDIHLEEYTEPYFLQEAVERINALQPDLVVLTGDFISRGPRSHAYAIKTAGLCAEILSTLTAPQCYAILGNHDVAVGSQPIINVLQAHGIPVLVDNYTPIERGDAHIWLSGACDPGTSTCYLELAIPPYPNAPVIFLCHEPDFVDTVVKHPRFPLIDLMLSGHTHGGQVRLPYIGPLLLPPMGQKYVNGLFHFGHLQLYVNRGLGTVGLPVRLNCPPEITDITLVRAPESARIPVAPPEHPLKLHKKRHADRPRPPAPAQ